MIHAVVFVKVQDMIILCPYAISQLVPNHPRSAAITAVAPCEEGCRYALRLLVLMQEDQIAPDRFTLTAIGG